MYREISFGNAMYGINVYSVVRKFDLYRLNFSLFQILALMQSTQVESTYGEVVSPDKAPEAISKAVASLPPEQMYELVKQMKQCVQVDKCIRINHSLYNGIFFCIVF